jgi:hypothetical protein
MSVSDVYAKLPEKYAAVRTCKHTEEDVAMMLIALDGCLTYEVLCFEQGPGVHSTFIATQAGIWELQAGNDRLTDIVSSVRSRLQFLLLDEIELLRCHLKGRVDVADNDALAGKLEEAVKHKLHLEWIDKKLGTSTFVNAVVRIIMRRKAMETAQREITMHMFDDAPGYLGFTDGVYDFDARALLTGEDARARLVTKTVGYAYEDVRNAADDDMAACDTFFAQIQTKEENRRFLLARLHNAARKRNDQVLLVHYNAAGANGKTTFFVLVHAAFGDLYMACDPALLVAAALSSPSAPNEELVSIKGMCVVAFSEPSAKTKLSAAFIKRITGGDEQSTRANYGKKQRFVFRGLNNLICNKIPQLDDFEGGMQRRMECIPYESTFVEVRTDADADDAMPTPEPHKRKRPISGPVFPMDKAVQDKFPTWRACLMRRILDAADAADAVPVPLDVKKHTLMLIDREDVLAKFLGERVKRTDDKKDITTLKEVWLEYKAHSNTRGVLVDYKDFEAEMQNRFGDMTRKSGARRDFWRGIKLIPEMDDHDSDSDPLEE